MSQATRVLGNPLATAKSGQSVDSFQDTRPTGKDLTKAILYSGNCTGCQLDNYTIGERIAAGGMGQVYQAKHNILGKSFAIKFMSEEVANDPEVLSRFHEEIKAVGKLKHDHIVQAIDAGQSNGIHYLVTEHLEGQDLAQLVARSGPIRLEIACDIIRQAALGLAYAHASGFVHRDIKPSNLFLQNNGCVKLLDFGISKNHANHKPLTQVGQFMGTVDYLSPEQAANPADADAQSDIYSLGCTLVFLLSGQPPYPDDCYPSLPGKLKGHMMDTPPYLESYGGEPNGFDLLIRSMLGKTKSSRPANCDFLALALAEYTDPALLKSYLKNQASAVCGTKQARWRASMLVIAASMFVVLGIAAISILKVPPKLGESPAVPTTQVFVSTEHSAVANPNQEPEIVESFSLPEPKVSQNRVETRPTDKVGNASAVEFSKQITGFKKTPMAGLTSKKEK